MGAKRKINILKRIKQYVVYKNPNQEIDEIRNFWHSGSPYVCDMFPGFSTLLI